MNIDGMKQPGRFLSLVLLLIVLPSSGGAGTGAAGVRHDDADSAGFLRRHNFSVNLQYPNVREQWQFDARSPMASAPAVADGRVFAGDGAGKMWALSLKTGAPEWRFTAGGPIRSTPAADGSRVVFASTDGSLCALKASNGKKLWQFAAEKSPAAPPCVTNNMVYFGTSDGRLRALGLEDGKLVWEFTGTGGPIETRPLVCNGKVIFGAGDGLLYALDEATGLLLWSWKAKGDSGGMQPPVAVWPGGSSSKLFVVGPDRHLAALDLAEGKEIWRTDAWQLGPSIGVAGDGSRFYARTMTNGAILAFATAADHAAKLWELDAPLGDDINSAMLVEKEGVLYHGIWNGLLLAIDPRSGTLLWEHQLGAAALNTVVPLDDPNEVLVSDVNGKITRVGPRQH
ncbi:MAG: PQQ-binding-like beta-propeller repeat protein [Limisphaerales bacterium]